MAISLKNHISLLSSNDMDVIAEPLKQFGIHLVNFVRLFKNGHRINLCNNPAWLQHFYNREFYKIGMFEGDPALYSSGYTLWPTLSGENIFYEARSCFDIDHGITIIKSRKYYCDFFYLAGHTNTPSIINFYLNNIDLLDRFILFFLDKGKSIINNAVKDPIILPLRSKLIIKQEMDNSGIILCQHASKEAKNIKQIFDINRYHLQIEGREVILSKREMDYLMAVCEGKNSKEIAKKFFRSQRTIENHLYNIKNKLNCNLRSELIKKFSGCDFYFGDI